MSEDLKQQRVMKAFCNTKAKERAPFYIATWRGYESTDLASFFLGAAEAEQFLMEASYTPSRHDRMLEIGCGIGRMTHGFAQLLDEVHAIDVSGEMIHQAKQHLAEFKNVYLQETSGTDLQAFSDGFFDFCFSFIVFQHIPAKSIIFNYIREVGVYPSRGACFTSRSMGFLTRMLMSTRSCSL